MEKIYILYICKMLTLHFSVAVIEILTVYLEDVDIILFCGCD